MLFGGCAAAVAALLALLSSAGAGARNIPAPGAAIPEAGPQNASTPQRVRLISEAQYFNSLAYIFGPDIRVDAHFAPFHRTDGLLELGATPAGVTSGQMELFQRTAAAVAARIVSPEYRGFLLPCKPARADSADNGCARRFLAATGRYLYRRPLSRALEADVVSQAGRAANQLHDFHAGLAVALEGMLISPEVLFIVERSEPDPARPGHRRLDEYSLASRMSFFLWNAAPDDALLQAAARGELYTPDGRAHALERMLASPRLQTGARAFFDDMLGFDDFDNLAKDAAVYPAFTSVTASDAREQTLRTVVDHLLVRNRDYRDLFTTRDTFMSTALAAIYQIPAPPGWTAYEVPAGDPRIGLLTQVSFLAAHSHPGRSSPTLRGKALRQLLLCQQVPRPPPNVDFSLIEDPKSAFRTARERLTAHRSNPVCAGCHKITDPIGLGLENFDGAGQYRDTEKGAAIDASGNLDGKQYLGPPGLAQALHDSPALPSCLVKRLYSYGTGGVPRIGREDEQLALPYLNRRFAEQGYRFADLLRSIVLSTAFSALSDEAPAGDAPGTGAPPQTAAVLEAK